MRMRRKKHLEERLSGVSNYLLITDKMISNVNEVIKDKKYLDYQEIFGNSNAVSLEVGCGKGGFATQFATINKNENILAVELLENIVVLACEKAKELGLNNVKFLNTSAEYLPRYILDNSIKAVYLNFSPPYPQKTHENRRLSNDRCCNIYKNALIDGGKIYLKTDDKDFFDYSFSKMIENGFSCVDITMQLNDNSIDNIQTEYEQKFRSQNMTIYGLIAQIKK